MSGNKIIICPGAFYNEHVEQQNIFGVVNVYPPKDGERGGQTDRRFLLYSRLTVRRMRTSRRKMLLKLTSRRMLTLKLLLMMREK